MLADLGITPTDLTAGVLLGIVILSIVLGRLIPVRTAERELADRDAQIASWKAAYEAERQRGEVQAEHLGELMELSRTTVAIVQALPRAMTGGSAS